MKMFNLNALQTYLSAAIVVIPMLLLKLGCTQLPTGDLDCANSVLSPTVAGYILAVLALLKFLVVPLAQPGGWFRNLFSPKAPLSTSDAPGTVHPANVVK